VKFETALYDTKLDVINSGISIEIREYSGFGDISIYVHWHGMAVFTILHTRLFTLINVKCGHGIGWIRDSVPVICRNIQSTADDLGPKISI
jgi:hypothetical protein